MLLSKISKSLKGSSCFLHNTLSLDEQQALQLKHHLKRVEETEVCVVVSSEQNEVKKFAKLDLDIEPHRKKIARRDLEKEFKKKAEKKSRGSRLTYHI